MSKLLFKLRNVPEDEADDVRNLLTTHQIDFYETSAGNWGISLSAIWITHDEQFDEAKRLFDSSNSTYLEHESRIRSIKKRR